MERSQNDAMTIYLEEAPKSITSIAATKAVRAKRDERLPDITTDELGISHNVVCCSDHWKRLAQASSDMTGSWRPVGMKSVISCSLTCIACQFAETRDTPYITRDVPF